MGSTPPGTWMPPTGIVSSTMLEASAPAARLGPPPLPAADEGAHIGGAAAGEERHVDAAGHRQIGPRPAPRLGEGHLVAGAHPQALPHRERLAIEGRGEIGAGDGDRRAPPRPPARAR